MNRLSTERRGQVISCLVEGMSIRATGRVTGVAKNTITKLLLDLGAACYGRPTTPAMAAGVATYPWSVTQIAALLD